MFGTHKHICIFVLITSLGLLRKKEKCANYSMAKLNFYDYVQYYSQYKH